MGVLNELREELDAARRDLAHEKQRYETDVEDLRRQVFEALDAKSEVQVALDAVTMAHLEEQQRWGIEREKLLRIHNNEINAYKEHLDFWMKEATAWSISLANYRQSTERYIAVLKKRAGSWRFLWFVMFATATVWAVAWAFK